jgi:hypothetical protein
MGHDLVIPDDRRGLAMTLISARLRPLLGAALAATLALAACADSDPSTVESDPGADGGA